MGAMVRLEKEEKGNGFTINVEYNQLEGLIKKEPLDADGYSLFPGNINTLIFETASYLDQLKKTGGIVNEFINPKYKDATKAEFKKDARLECMMQDYPKTLTGTSAVAGFTQLDRWLCYSPVKNSLADAKAKQGQNLAADSASCGEADIYFYSRRLLRERAEIDVDVNGAEMEFAGVKVRVGAKIVLSPSFAATQAEAVSKFVGKGAIRISKQSTLVIQGEDVVIKSLDLDGTLVIRAEPGCHVVVENLTIKNKGWSLASLEKDSKAEAFLAIRGYALKREEACVAAFQQAAAGGSFTLSDATKGTLAKNVTS